VTPLEKAASEAVTSFGMLISAQRNGSPAERARAWDETYLAMETLDNAYTEQTMEDPK